MKAETRVQYLEAAANGMDKAAMAYGQCAAIARAFPNELGPIEWLDEVTRATGFARQATLKSAWLGQVVNDATLLESEATNWLRAATWFRAATNGYAADGEVAAGTAECMDAVESARAACLWAAEMAMLAYEAAVGRYEFKGV